MRETHLAHGRAVRRVEVDVVLPDEEHVAHALRPRRGRGSPRLERRRRRDALHRRPPRARRFERLRRRRRRVHPHAAGKRRAAFGDVLPEVRERRRRRVTRNRRRVLRRRRRRGGRVARLSRRLQREMLALSPQAWFERGHAARRARTPAAATLRARESRFVRAQRAKCEGSKPPNESRGARASLCGGRASPRTFVPFRGNARPGPVIATFSGASRRNDLRALPLCQTETRPIDEFSQARGVRAVCESPKQSSDRLTERRP